MENIPEVRQSLLDKDDGRLKDMDAGNVSFQVLSQLPGIGNENPSGCQAANDELAQIVQKNPTRFGGFAALAMAYPDEAARELERAVKQLGLLGAMIDNHLPGMTHYGSEKYWPVFEMAERLDVPIYIHPAPASEQAMAGKYRGNYDERIAMGLSTGAWGWHEELGLHVIKLYAAGVFQRFPGLQIIVGHMGELLPMMIDRIDRLKFFKREGLGPISEVWKKNIWVTTSGIFSTRTLEMLLKVTSIDRVLYSVDTPFERSDTGWGFIERIKRDGVLSDDDLEKFVYGNAQKLLKIP